MSFLNLKALAVLGICFCIACGSARSSKQSKHTEIRLAVSRGSLLYMPVFLAGPAGCFEKQKLAPIIEETEGAPKSFQALLGGSVDVVAGGYLQLLDLVARGQPLQAFVVMQRFPGFAAIVSPRASKPIHTVTDLKGVKIGVSSPGSESQRILNYILGLHGIRPEDINVIGVGPSVTQVPSLERGVVDVTLSQGVTISFLQRRHSDLVMLFDTRTPALTKAALGVEEMPESVLLTRENWLRANPDTARRLATAFQCSLTWIQDHTPEQIREVLPASCRSQDSSADLEAILSAKHMLSSDGRMTPKLHDAAVRVSGIVNQTNLNRAYTNEFLGR
jgi:NitT/TauT family transport system substrate-binding protein